MRKNEKGFTLVELLGVVVILGALITIVIASVTGVVKKSHEEYNQKQVKMLTLAGQTYFTDNKGRLPKAVFTDSKVTLKELKKENYIKEMVDHKQRPYKEDDSFAVVKKLTGGNYQYSAILVGQDGRYKDGNPDAKTEGGKNTNINIVFGVPNTDDTSNHDRQDGRYYINGKIAIPVTVTYQNDLVAYRYRINKIDDKNSSKSKVFYESNYLGVNEEGQAKISDNIALSQKKLSDGVYELEVEALDTKGKYNTEKFGNLIEIDGTKPKCTIEMNGEVGEYVDKINKVGPKWFKAGDLTATITITEKNKSQYAFTFDEEPEYKQIENDATTIESPKIEENHNGKDNDYMNGHLIDKAGNQGVCKTKDPVYYDNTPPTCEITRDREPEFNGWYREDVTISYDAKDEGGGIYKYNFNTNNNDNLDKNGNGEFEIHEEEVQGDTTGITYYGKVKDEAGNDGLCDTGEPSNIKVDTVGLTCNTKTNWGPDGTNNWYINPVDITGVCNSTKPSGCINGTGNINSDSSTATGKPGDVIDGTGRTEGCEEISVQMELNDPEIDSSSTNMYGGHSEDGNVWTNGNDTAEYNGYTVTTTWKNSISGFNKIKRIDNGDETCTDCDVTPNDSLRNSGYTSYTSNKYRTETSKDGRKVCYYIISNAGRSSRKDFCEDVYIDNTPPSHKEMCFCRSVQCASCSAIEPYVLKYKIEDTLSGIYLGTFYWAWPASFTDGVLKYYGPQNNPYTIYSNTRNMHYGYIGVKNENGPYGYEICDFAGNCTDTDLYNEKKVNADKSCSSIGMNCLFHSS